MKTIGYVRQSKERKDRDSISPDTQIEKIHQFAKLQDAEVVSIFQDIDISGFKVHYSKRTGLMELLKFIKENQIEKVYVYALSRLSRRIKDFIEITDVLEEYGVSVVSVTEMVDMSTPQGRLFRNILLSFNEYYSDSLSATIVDNHKKNVQLGKWNGGHVPYGYDWIKSEMKFVRNEKFIYLQEIIAKAADGWGVKKISNYLNRRKVDAPKGKTWHSQTVKYILTNEFYRGLLSYDGQHYESELTEVIIDENKWRLIKANLERYNELGPRGKVSPHLLTGIIQCGHCGNRLEIRYNGSSKVRRYICAGRQYSQGDKCTAYLVDADGLESAILKHISALVKSSYFDEIIHESNNLSKPKQNSLQSEIKRLEKELSGIVGAQQDLYEEAFIHKRIKKERFYEMDKLFDEEREKLEKEIKIMYKEVDSTDTTFIFDYKEALENFVVLFNELSQEEQRSAIHALIDKIVVHNDYVQLVLPVDETKIKSTSIKRGTIFYD